MGRGTMRLWNGVLEVERYEWFGVDNIVLGLGDGWFGGTTFHLEFGLKVWSIYKVEMDDSSMILR